jgi:hypothetical protein
MNNLDKCLEPEFPKEIRKIKESIPVLKLYSNVLVETMWRRFSDAQCAQYLTVNNDLLEMFEEWLFE